MIEEKKSPSLFHKLVAKEDDYTQVLCNLTLRFPPLGLKILAYLLGENEPRMDAANSFEIVTQVSLKADGRPDAIIKAPGMIALLG